MDTVRSNTTENPNSTHNPNYLAETRKESSRPTLKYRPTDDLCPPNTLTV